MSLVGHGATTPDPSPAIRQHAVGDSCGTATIVGDNDGTGTAVGDSDSTDTVSHDDSNPMDADSHAPHPTWWGL